MGESLHCDGLDLKREREWDYQEREKERERVQQQHKGSKKRQRGIKACVCARENATREWERHKKRTLVSFSFVRSFFLSSARVPLWKFSLWRRPPISLSQSSYSRFLVVVLCRFCLFFVHVDSYAFRVTISWNMWYHFKQAEKMTFESNSKCLEVSDKAKRIAPNSN